MDKDLIEVLVNLKVDAKAFNMLVDTILNNCRINYNGTGLTINDDDEILAIIKAFRPEEYNNCLKYLKDKAKIEEGADNVKDL